MVLSPTLSMYKNLITFAKRLPKLKKDESIRKIQEEFRKNSNEHNPERIEELLKYANSTLGYLKIVTPKRLKDQTGHSKIVFGDDSKINKAVSNWTGNNLDPDSVSRHYRSLKRAGFKDNSSAKGIF
jgi:hypothetical protein